VSETTPATSVRHVAATPHPPRATNEYDAIVIGGGHNGLIAGAYLARAGLRAVVLEARADLGGAARTEQPFGPDFKVTALSYVMSLMPPTIQRDLNLAEHGYRVVPMGPSYFAFPDGRSLTLELGDDADRNEIAKFSQRDAANYQQYWAWLKGVADVLAPLLLTTPPRLASKRPKDLIDQLRLVWGMRGLDVRTSAEATRLFTMSIADVLDRWFESPELKGALAVNGIIGTWAGPDEPGTAYVMMHHTIGDVGDGQLGSWGFPIGGMGAVSEACARSARSFGCEIRTEAPVERITTRGGRVTGVVLRGGEELRASTVMAATHPQITFLRQLDRNELPAEFVRDLEAWRSRSGVVKVNVALGELPDFIADPGTQQHARHTGAIELCHSIEYLERAFQDARSGQASARPFADCVIPSTLDPTIAPAGAHVMSMYCQWVPHTWADAPDDAGLAAFADRVVDSFNELAPNFKQSILHRQVIGPHEMQTEYGLIGGNIFHGELSTDQLFHMRPAPGYADFTTPIKGLYQCSSATHGGGGVTGIPALLATRRVLRDRAKASITSRLRRSKSQRDQANAVGNSGHGE
jgi:phytoene dehydrogenase-like protein